MDNEALYGPAVFAHPLGQAIEEGVPASFEIDVLEIRDPAPTGDEATLQERRGARLGATWLNVVNDQVAASGRAERRRLVQQQGRPTPHPVRDDGRLPSDGEVPQ